jgi:carboxyl-terminal processing protease
MNTDDEFDKALNELKEKGMEKLIIDLRDNSGGYLSTVTNMISKFVDKNTVIYQIKDKNKITKYTALNNETLNYKTVILVNENSASASEIMTSALQEQYGATIVGTKTYGKGTVQQTKDLSNGTLIKYTIEEWLTSNGKSIEKEGVNRSYCGGGYRSRECRGVE